MEEEKIIPRKIALFGGSFDPVTNAHCALIKSLCERFDKVVVIPCFLSPFKLENNITDENQRIKMLEKALEDYENVKISKWEINRQQTSFTHLTVEHFAEKYPNDELYFVIGSDGLSTLSKWKNVKEICEKATFYLVKRPDYSINHNLLERLNKGGIRIILADFDGQVGSSSEARVANAFGLLEDLVPKKVAKYIAKKELYSDYCNITANYNIFNLKPERVAHTFRVAKTGIALAKINNINLNSAITAILLHDVGKYADEQLLKRLSVTVPDEVNLMPPPIRHAPISAAIAKQYFKINDADILSAITTHTTGAPKMNPLQMLVYLADAVEEGREFQELGKLRNAVFASMEKSMVAVIKNTIDYIEKAGGEVYYKTTDAYHYYTQLEKINIKKKTDLKETTLNAENVLIGKDEKMPTTKKTQETTADDGELKKTAVKKTVTKKKVEPTVTEQELNLKAATNLSGEIKTPEELANKIACYLDDKKARDIVLVDLMGKTIIADYFVIASTSSTTAVRALTEYVDEKLSKDYKIEPLRRDIDEKWAAIDYGSVILHILLDETRDFYQIEKLWNNGTNVKFFTKD